MENLRFNTPENETLYVKALYKTIFPEELKIQLDQVGLLLKHDSYLVKTLKLRLFILNASHGPAHLRESLEQEIQKESHAQHRYNCCVQGCLYVTVVHAKYLKHYNSAHKRSSQKFICKLDGCQREFISHCSARKHVEIQHHKQESSVARRQSVLVEQLISIKCASMSCGKQSVSSVKQLKVHLKFHFGQLEKVSCIFANCNYASDNYASLKMHFSRKHRKQDADELKVAFVDITEGANSSHPPACIPDTTDEEEHEDILYDEGENDADEGEDDAEEDEESPAVDEVFMRSLAISMNTWMNISGISYSTVNQIVTEIFDSYGLGAEVTKSRVKVMMSSHGVSESIVHQVLDALATDDPFKHARKMLESEFKRKRYILEQFPNVLPETVKLNQINEELASYQYVSIKESLKLLLEDETYIKQVASDPYYPEEDQIKDIRDGQGLKKNPFFTANTEAVPLLIFQGKGLKRGTELKLELCPVCTINFFPFCL